MRTRIQLCGRLSIAIDGNELVGALRGRQVPLLLAYLVLHRDRALARDELIDAMWPDHPPRSQDAALRTLLSRLRSGLGSDAITGRDEVALELPEPVWVDLEAATAQVQRAGALLADGDARGAWALAQVSLNIASRGLLPGTRASWLEPARRELAEVRLQALEVVGRAGLELGGTQLASVQRAARTLIESEPYRESGYVLLMGALADQGNVAEAVRVYERLRALLRDELGTTPSREALAAHERLLAPAERAAPGVAERDGDGGDGEDGAIELPAGLRARASSEIVGRCGELETLRGWWSQGAAGAQRVLLLSGAAGVGKTRLLAELATELHTAGAVVLAGHGHMESLVPYQPLLEAIGHYAFHAPIAQLRAATRSSGVDGSELTRLLPELRRRLPELRTPEPGDPETDRYRLFEAVAGVLGEIARRGPLLLVLDDLQWADRPTLLLLRHLIRAPQAARLRILGAYRTEETWGEGFAAALATLRHEGLLAALELSGLPEPDAVELVRVRAGGSPSAGFLRALYAETDGNPFFIEEIVRHLAESGVAPHEADLSVVRRVGLPDDVRELITRRLSRLSDDGREWLRVASVIGRDVNAALLERVLGYDEDRFLEALEESVEAGLVTEAPGAPGNYTFAHALVRETLYAGMSSPRRARVHRRVGLALEHTGGDDVVDALAYHFTRAGDPADAERAITYALAAGARATAMLANEEAAEHYARALEVLERADPDARERRCALLLELGDARLRSGERPTARPVFREAATLAAALGDRAALIRAALGASRRYIQPPGVVDHESIAMLEQALEMTAGERTVTRVRLLSRLCAALYFSDRREEMRRLSAEATALAVHLGDPEASALAAAARRRAWWGPDHLERRLADSTMMLRSAREADDLELTLQGHAWLIVDLLEVGDITAVRAQVDAFAEEAESLRQPLYQWNAVLWRAMLALLEGRLADAERLATDALAAGIRPDGVTAPQYYAMQLAAIRREQLRMGEVETATLQISTDYRERAAWRAGLATTWCSTGRTERARAELESLIPDPSRRGFEATPAIAPDGDWLTAIALLSEVAVALGDAERAATLYELLAPHREAAVVIGVGAVCLGAAARYRGLLALCAGRRADGLEDLERALEINAALRAHVQLAHTRLDYASALGAGTRARELVADAAATAAEHDLPFVARRVERVRARL